MTMLRAILCVDLVGYTSTLEERGAEVADARIQRLEGHVRVEASVDDGEVLPLQSDSVTVLFAGPHAVEAAARLCASWTSGRGRHCGSGGGTGG
jgi:class 3 adenylate cyclase